MKKITYLTLGFISLALGILGMALPLLPTVPFFLLTSWLFYRSSERNYIWLMNHPVFGTRLRQYQMYRAIPAATKRLGITLLWASLAFSIWLVKKPIVSFILPVVGLAVSWHIASIRSLSPAEQAEWAALEANRQAEKNNRRS